MSSPESAPQPLIPGIDQVLANLQDLPLITGRTEQFIGPAGSGPPTLITLPQYGGLVVEPRAVPATNFDAFEHRQLVANVQPIQPESVDGYRQEWARAANGVADAFATLATTIGRAIADKWQGASGAAAAAAIVGYARDANGMADASNLVARQVGLLVDSLDRTKLELPSEPAETVPARLAGLVGMDSWDDERRDAARQQAVRFLDTVYYGGGISPTAQGLPAFPPVVSPIAGGVGAGTVGLAADGSSSAGFPWPLDALGGSAAGSPGSGVPTGWGNGVGSPVGSPLDRSDGSAGSGGPAGYSGDASAGGTADGSSRAAPAVGPTASGIGRNDSALGTGEPGGSAVADSRERGDRTDPWGEPLSSDSRAGRSDTSETSGRTAAADYGSPVGAGVAGSGVGPGGLGSASPPAGPGMNGSIPGTAGSDGPHSGTAGSGRAPGGAGGGMLGSPMLGGVVSGAGAGPSGRPAAASPGRAGAPGLGMAPVGAGRGQGADERGRGSPEYLANDELRQWIERQAERAGPSVLGAVVDPVRSDDGRSTGR